MAHELHALTVHCTLRARGAWDQCSMLPGRTQSSMLLCVWQVTRDWDELSKAEVIPELRSAAAAAEVSWQPVNKQYCVGH